MNLIGMKSIQDFIVNEIRPFDFNSNFNDILNIMEEEEFSHFPVVENHIYMGSIASIDIIPSATKKVDDYKYTLSPYFVRNNWGWFEVLEKFAQFDCNVIAVLDENNNYLGYYRFNDINTFFKSTPFLKDAGLTIVVQKHYLDYSISEIAQIVESNNSKLLGIFISSMHNNIAEITVKAFSGNINEIIQTFRRFGYDIVSEHNQDIYLSELKDRSAYLDKYLNI